MSTSSRCCSRKRSERLRHASSSRSPLAVALDPRLALFDLAERRRRLRRHVSGLRQHDALRRSSLRARPCRCPVVLVTSAPGIACFTSQIVSSPGVMRSRTALNAVATGPLWSISSSPPAISKPSVVAVPTHIPLGSRVSVSSQQRPDQSGAIRRHRRIGDRARAHLVGHVEHRVEHAGAARRRP